MPKYLFIIESPGKTRKIKSFLDSSFEVIATKGHIIDLPPNKFSVNIKKDFEPTYAVMDGKESVVKEIKKKSKKADLIYLATDLDREGSGIAASVVSILPKGKEYKRVIYSSITKSAIVKAIEEAGDIDMDMVHSYECRRILDRIVGYKCSYITKQATGGRSAGRVQSAALRIIADREKEIRDFIPKEYWFIEAELERKNKERVKAVVKKPPRLKINSKEKADKICELLRTKLIKVSKYEVTEASTKAFAPFTTSSLYQSGSSILGWGSAKTASVSQKLYENGLISYHRTDSTFIVPEFMDTIRTKIASSYGNNYLSPKINVFSNKKSAQEAHEAIRVTDVCVEHLQSGDEDEKKLYKIIWKRTIASQMASMRQKKGVADFVCEDCILTANGSKVVFDGWRKVWNYGNVSDTELPELTVGELMKLIDLTCEQKFTQPPSRYTEASFIKELESRGIGRPSTYKTTITTLLDREYTEKKKKVIYATDMGIKVSDFLIDSNFCFIDLGFTAEMEENLDKIAHKEAEKLCILRNFWERLKSDLDNAKVKRNEMNKTDYPCPKCQKKGQEGFLVLKHSKYGPFYSCSNRKELECDYKADVNKENGCPVEKQVQEKKYSDIKCPNCGEKFLIRISKNNKEYLGCRNWASDQKCRGFFKMDGEKMVFKKKKYYKKKNG